MEIILKVGDIVRVEATMEQMNEHNITNENVLLESGEIIEIDNSDDTCFVRFSFSFRGYWILTKYLKLAQ